MLARAVWSELYIVCPLGGRKQAKGHRQAELRVFKCHVDSLL